VCKWNCLGHSTTKPSLDMGRKPHANQQKNEPSQTRIERRNHPTGSCPPICSIHFKAGRGLRTPLRNGSGARLTSPTAPSTPVKDRHEVIGNGCYSLSVGSLRHAFFTGCKMKIDFPSPVTRLPWTPADDHQDHPEANIRMLCRNGAISWLVRSAC
jgi:hypothetical protein